MGFIQEFDYTVFDSLIDNNIRFAVYRLAWQKEKNLIIQTSQDVEELQGFERLNMGEGFVVAPFHLSIETPLILIRPDVYMEGDQKIFDYLSDQRFTTARSIVDIHDQSASNSFEQYNKDYESFFTSLTAGKFQKLVLSRTFDTDRRNSFSVGDTFRKACEKYLSNFVYLCNTPETGTWMGVSPELLVAEHQHVYKTVALAGTRKLSASVWDDKNREEQQIVVDYMQQQLSKIGKEIVQEDPITVQAGNIEHLKTKFSFQLQDGVGIGDLLGLLHPSPAVCGFPKESTFNFILDNESYDRRYYSGFVGPLNIEGNSRLYVNLRCMQIGKDLLRLYAGGGMLPSSTLRAEWEETENKLQTILSVID